MRIAAFEIENFKSFLSTPEIELPTGFVVIVGQNNAGKTALLQALSLHKFINSPHRSPKTMPKRNSALPPRSRINITFEVSGEDIKEMLYGSKGEVFIPIPESPPPDMGSYLSEFYRRLDKGSFYIRYEIEPTLRAIKSSLIGFTHPSQGPVGVSVYIYDQENAEHQLSYSSSIKTTSIAGQEYLQSSLVTRLFSKIYIFDAERFPESNVDEMNNDELASNISNLPRVLHILSTRNSPRFNRFMGYVRRVFPQITMVTTPSQKDALRTEIRIWDVDPDLERDDLSFSLAECGTGVSHVLAILYILVTAETPRIILIDEPQSFLHPGAIRRLFEVLRENQHHQYIISTHSSTVIAAADPEAILLIKKNQSESTITSLDMKSTHDANLVLREIGARLTDVFGAENILWVEGQTEETCFPLILSVIVQKPLLGTVVRGVISTGDFDKRSRELTLRIYQSLSEGTGILPAAIGFIFDREKQNDSYMDDLKRSSGGKVFFLKRRMFENYLLDVEAIASVMSEENFRDNTIPPDEIQKWIDSVGWNREYIDSKTIKNKEHWITEVHAAKLLHAMFAHFSEGRHEFKKTAHSVALAIWLVEHKPETLREVADVIDEALEKGRQRIPVIK